MLNLNINNETDTLQSVVLGIASDFGGLPKLADAFDPTSKQHIQAGTYPAEKDLLSELDFFKSILKKHNVDVLHPTNITNCNQIFTRDVAFVIEDKIIISRMIHKRQKESTGFDKILNRINAQNIIQLPKSAQIEGGDVIPHNEYIFIGTSTIRLGKLQVSRTNNDAIDALKSLFPAKKIKSFNLIKSDNNPNKSALHLDCCLQPIGEKHVIICKEAFVNQNDINWLEFFFGKENLIEINLNEMQRMFANIFSISKKTIVSEKKITRLNNILRKLGFTVETIPYSEVSKMGGMLRCSTLPLFRKS